MWCSPYQDRRGGIGGPAEARTAHDERATGRLRRVVRVAGSEEGAPLAAAMSIPNKPGHPGVPAAAGHDRAIARAAHPEHRRSRAPARARRRNAARRPGDWLFGRAAEGTCGVNPRGVVGRSPPGSRSSGAPALARAPRLAGPRWPVRRGRRCWRTDGGPGGRPPPPRPQRIQRNDGVGRDGDARLGRAMPPGRRVADARGQRRRGAPPRRHHV